ncbi:BTAD domain-containing putative transcriptional regulator [Kitasatospora sp. NPDC056783]|uniref:AfsR/SARP family transcriptional regulator n=1 Tax=Kitasatospora sp. NPDC056783 TaxID=3345943 RepID=UPI0036AC2D94
MKFNILGPLEVLDKGIPCTPSALKVRWTLAILLVNANRIVDLDLVIEEIWGSDPPRTVITTAQTYIYQLRKLCRPLGRDVILTKAPGYVLLLGEEEFDAQEFERLHQEGDRLLAAGRAEQAADRLRRALDLWRGAALADIPAGSLLAGHVAVLEEMRLRALESRILADRHLGRHRELVPELRLLALRHPWNEWYHEQLMIALDAAGRRSEALHVYRTLYRRLDEDLGISPSQPLRDLQNELLSGTAPARREFQALAARAVEDGLRARSA